MAKKMSKIFILLFISSILTGCIIHGYPGELSYYNDQQEYETSTENYSQNPTRTRQSFVTPQIDKKKKIKKYKKRKRVKARRYKRIKKRLRRDKKSKKVSKRREQREDKKKKRKKKKKSD